MKKITFLFAMLLAMLGTTAKAQVVAPAISEGDNVYEYYIRFYNSSNYVKTTVGEGGNLRVTGTDKLKVKFVAAATDGYVNIIPTNVEGYNFIAAEGAVHSSSAIKFYTEAQTAYSEWKFEVNMDGTDRWYNLILKDGETSGLSFCMFKSATTEITQVGTFNHASSENACRIQFEAANDAAKAAAFNLAPGYYKMESVGRADQYLKNDIAREDMQTLQTTVGNTNNFIWKVEVSGKTLTVLNGLGTPIKVGTTSYPTMDVIAVPANKASESYVFDNYLNRNNGGDAADNKTLYVWPSDGYAVANQWFFEAVEGTAYTVVLVDAPEEATVTRTVGDVTETAFNGGFFMTTATTLDGTIAATHIEGYTASEPVIDESEKTITINYTHNLTEYINALREDNEAAKALLAKTGMGYPTEDAEARTALAAYTLVVDEVVSTNNTDNYTEVEILESKVNAYTTCTDVQLPENGKAYTITSVSTNGKKHYMNYTDNGYTMVECEDGVALPSTAVLVCRDLGESKYAFVNNAGKYFMWKGSTAGNNNQKGYADTFDATNENSNTVLTVVKLNASGHTDQTQAAALGYVAIKGNRSNGSTPNYFVIQPNGKYEQADAMFFNSGFSSALLLEEVTYPNTPAVSASIDDVFVGTFSAPFPTVVPKDVTAYEITGKNTESNITCNVLANAGEAIPANTGVLLASSASKASVTMLPATTETAGTPNGNLLVATGAEGTTVDAETTAYILANGSQDIAFYLLSGTNRTIGANKAYLAGLQSAAVLKLNFSAVTGIDSIDNEELTMKDAPIYDLSGRRVLAPAKGGIYVKNGKKFIVK